MAHSVGNKELIIKLKANRLAFCQLCSLPANVYGT